MGKDAQVNAVNQNGCTPTVLLPNSGLSVEGGANPDDKDNYEAIVMYWALACDRRPLACDRRQWEKRTAAVPEYKY